MGETNISDSDQPEQPAEFQANLGAIHFLAEKEEADVFVVSGNIDRSLANFVVDAVDSIEKTRPNVVVFLCTYGGFPDPAYIIARTFKRTYEKFSLYISGYCKSAGTLIALGANEIAMGNKGELGPLDVQLPTEDSFTSTSGLDSTESIFSLQFDAIFAFHDIFSDLIEGSEGRFTTRTAASIAAELVVGLFEPIAAQIDPLKLAKNRRALSVAQKYGEQLGANSKVVRNLIYNYPSHGHVIDFSEARKLFGNSVRQFDELDAIVELETKLFMMKRYQRECVRLPFGTKYGENVVVHLNPVNENHDIQNSDNDEEMNGNGPNKEKPADEGEKGI